MIVQKIDLYKHFGINRKGGEQGYLTTYARPLNDEEPQNKKRPAMLIIAGGGYKIVSNREKECVALQFLQRGYNCFVLDYSVDPCCYPTQISEAAMAMLYVRETANQFATDAQHAGAIGFSAGAHLTAMLSSVCSNADVKRLLGEHVINARPDAVVLCYGVVSYDKSNTHISTFDVVSDGGKIDLNKVDPVQLVTDKTSPAFLWHTADDTVVPFTNSVNYALALKKHNVPFELHVFQNGCHGLSLATEESACNSETVNVSAQQWVELALNWLSVSQGFGLKFQ
ncbi:MAG: alpha/beta hydrolase [Corallococcus sp.]|nr:alpha/beta hydrolase [Corallococcus sp.]MCM1359813.1 alpha/beta hydrolase [Corallococcus sp.]MCM1395247.1 alpha/beta hydrolase [Corallococcus sp.]